MKVRKKDDSNATKKEEDFINEADKSKEDKPVLNPKEARKKHIGYKVNLYEYERLERLSEKYGRNIADTMRVAIDNVCDKEQK